MVRRDGIIPEYQTSCNTTDASKANKRGAGKSTLPLSTNVVGLVTHCCRDVCVGTGRDEENTKVAGAGVAGKPHDWQADDAQEHVEGDDRSTNPEVISSITSGIHDQSAEDVWRGDEALRGSNAESHIYAEDDGKEVSQSIGDRSGAKEDQGISPDLPVRSTAEELLEGERLGFSIATVSLDTVDDPALLALVEKAPGLVLAIWETNQEPVTSKADETGDLLGVSKKSEFIAVARTYNALHDEDPPPATHITETIHLHKLQLSVMFLVR